MRSSLVRRLAAIEQKEWVKRTNDPTGWFEMHFLEATQYSVTELEGRPLRECDLHGPDCRMDAVPSWILPFRKVVELKGEPCPLG